MSQSLGQFCPIALASEVLTQKWMLLVLRELISGTSRFNAMRRGIPKISATLLKQRLETLERADIVYRQAIPNSDQFEYRLTTAGLELKPIVTQIGIWGQRWARDIAPEDLDPAWLVWAIHRYLNFDELPSQQTVIEFEFTDAAKNERFFWIVVNDRAADVCIKNPGLSVDLIIKTKVIILAEAFRGIRNLQQEVRSLRIIVQGDKRLKEKLTAWLKPSDYAATQRQAKKC